MLDDKILVAFVDGELDPFAARAVEDALRDDPGAASRAQVLRESAALLRSAFGDGLHAPVPERLRAAIARPSRYTSRWQSARGPIGGTPAGMRIAATVALLLIGGMGGWAGADLWGGRSAGSATEQAIVAARGTLVQATLESTKSGGSNVWRDPEGKAMLVVAPVRTFRDEDEHFCREFRETVSREGVRTLLRHGVACRNASGQWETKYYVVPGANPPPALISG